MTVIGTETQSLERQPHLTGVPRVASALNDALLSALSDVGIDLRRVHTWPDVGPAPAVRGKFLDDVRILQAPVVAPEDVDACVFLDVSHVNFPRLFAPAMRRIPKVFFLHDLLPIQHPEWFPAGAAPGYRLFVRQVLAVADHIVCSTRHVANQLTALGWPSSADIHVLPLGSHVTPQPAHATRAHSLSLLYVSTVEPRKGHDLLLDTFDLLLARGEDVELTLVGRRGWDVQHGWQVEGIIERITHHPLLGTRLRWHQCATDEDVVALASGATHGVVPPIDEGFGLFVEEGLALGLTVVASDIPVFAERPHPRLRLAERHPEAFAQAIVDSAHDDPGDRSEPAVRTLADAAGDWARLLENLT